MAGWMSELSANGHYDVGEEVLGKIRRDFSAGFCTDAGASVEIARVWAEHGYLIDTHTAVASAVLAADRCGTGDETPTAIVSTASPYKFCTSVLASLGVSSDAPGHELIPSSSASPTPRPRSARGAGAVSPSASPAVPSRRDARRRGGFSGVSK